MNKIKNIKIQPKYYWIISFLLTSLAMYVMLSYSQLLSTGKYIILAGDTREQYIAQIRMFIRSILNGDNPFFSFSVSMGLNTIIPIAWHTLSPFNILYLIFWKVNVNIITATVIILKTGMSATTFQLFVSKAFKEKGFSSILFSFFYAMCSFATVYGMYQMIWLDGLYVLPLVALGIYLLVFEKKPLLLTLSYAYIFIIQFYMGYMIGIFSFLLFVLLIIFYIKEKKEIIAIVFKYTVSFFTAVAISSVIWIPFGLFLLSNRSTDVSKFETIKINLFEVINNLFWGQFQGISYAPYVYCGIPALIFVILFFFSKKIDTKEKTLWGIILLFFFICCIIDPLYMLMHAFDAPDGYAFRFSFIISFIICSIACKYSNNVKELSETGYKVVIIVLLLFYLLEQNFEELKIGQWSTNTNIGFLVNGLLLILWSVFFLLLEKQKKTMRAFMLLLAMTEMISNGVVRCSDELSIEGFEREEQFYAWDADMRETMESVSALNDSNDIFYRMVVYNDSITHNGDSYWGYNGITDFETGENQKLREFLKKMGLYTTAASTYPTGMTPTLESLLAIKYSVRLFTDINAAGYEIHPSIIKNENVLPIGFMVKDSALDEIEFTNNVFENQNLVFEKLSGVDKIYKEIPVNQKSCECTGMSMTDNYIVQTESQSGQIIFRASNIQGDAFLQIDSSELMSGLYYMDGVLNKANKNDNLVCIPFSAKMFGTGEEKYIMIYSDSTFPGALGFSEINMYELDEKKYDSLFGLLNKETLHVEDVRNGYIKGRISLSGEQRILFTSIPYVDGWKAYVNGKKEKIVPVLNETFIGIELPEEGDYSIELKYDCPGLTIGAIISLVGVMAMVFQQIIICNRNKNSLKDGTC